jgi:hypothetical protein
MVPLLAELLSGWGPSLVASLSIWAIACFNLLIQYKPYKKYVNDMTKLQTSSLNNEETIQKVTSGFDEERKNEFIRFNCACGQKIKVEKESAGKIGKCPECQRRLHVPES